MTTTPDPSNIPGTEVTTSPGLYPESYNATDTGHVDPNTGVYHPGTAQAHGELPPDQPPYTTGQPHVTSSGDYVPPYTVDPNAGSIPEGPAPEHQEIIHLLHDLNAKIDRLEQKIEEKASNPPVYNGSIELYPHIPGIAGEGTLGEVPPQG